MASPQKENGYTPIANEILEAVMRQRLGGTQLRLVLAVWRYTYGFNRRQHQLSESFLARAVDAHPKQVARELRALVKKRMLRVAGRDAASGAHILAFHKNYDEWEGADRLGQQERKRCGTGNKNAGSDGNRCAPQEKQTYQIQTEKQEEVDAFFEELWKRYPKKRGKSAVRAESKQALFALGFARAAACVRRYCEKVEANGTPERFILYGSTFFNGRYRDYLEEEEARPEEDWQ